jgi:CBS domain-containing protein
MKPWNERTAADVMKSPVLSLDSDTTLGDAAAWMSDNQISGAAVLDHTGRPVGVVSLFDIVTSLSGLEAPKGGFYRTTYPKFEDGGDGWEKGWEDVEPDALKNTPVSEIMTPELHTVEETSSLPDVTRMMYRKHIHRVFVSRKGTLVGVISTMDVLGVLAASGVRRPAARARA